jgi:diguanylate cyclase (GGDEF)-like protein
MVAVDLFALDNPFVLPDVADLSWKLRLWLTPLCLLTLASLRLPLRGWKLDAIFAATAVAVALAVLGLIGASHVGVAVSHLPALLLVPMFAAVVMRLRFWPALGASLTILLAIPVFLHGRDPTQTAIVRDAGLVVTVATLISLLACYALERRDRTAFLMELRDRRRRQALNEANERLRRLSMLDPLTGVYNRSQFDIDLETAWMHAAFTGEPLSLLVVDVDCFKELIDGSGRLEADTCLRRIAGVLGDVAAESKGTVARLASEEFAILLPGRTLESAVRIGESLRRAVLALRVANEDSTVAEHVSVSVGAAAALPTAQDKPVALLQTADDALHQAKGGGRNRVVACRMQTSMTLAAGLH